MFQLVLIGVEGRQGGRDAIALARQLAAPGAVLSLAHIETAPVGAVTRMDRTRSEHMLVQERDAAGLEARLLTGFAMSVGGGLHELADESGADLLVVGSNRRGLIGRVALGDDSLAALTGAPCAVAIATRGHADGDTGFRTIGVGYDFSPESEAAFNVARSIAERYGARLRVFHVVSLPEVSEERPLPADWPAEIEALIKQATERLGRLGDVDAVVSYGGPDEELAQHSGDVDLMVVGSRGFGPLARLFHGSVSHYLVRHARSPVLVLPRPADQPDQAPPADAAAPG